MPPQLEVLITGVDARLDCVLPTLEFNLRITNRTGEITDLVLLQYEIYLAKPIQHGTRPTIGREDRFLTSGLIAIHNMPVGQTKEAKIHVPLTIDLNNAIYEELLALEREELVFKLKFYGVYMYRASGGTPHNVSSITFYGTGNQLILEATLTAERWRRMVSEYYRNITWIAISRETFYALKKILDEKGYVSYDEVIRELLKTIKRES